MKSKNQTKVAKIRTMLKITINYIFTYIINREKIKNK